MTTLAERRAELDAAIVAQGVPVAASYGRQNPPYAVILGDSTDLRPSAGGVRWAFTVRGVEAKVTDLQAVPAMDALSWALVAAAWGLAGFRVDGLGAVGMRDLLGALYYTVDLSVSTTVDFA
jgi:hypothetical protein